MSQTLIFLQCGSKSHVNKYIQDEDIVQIAKNPLIPELRELVFSQCNFITSRGFIDFFSSKINLNQCKTLEINGCHGFDDISLESLFSANIMKSINSLSLCSLINVSDNILKRFLNSKNIENLSKLNLRNCVNLSNKAIQTLSDLNLANLKYLNLKGCYQITDEAIKALAKSNTSLDYLNISSCSNITGKSLQFLTESKQKSMKLKIFKMKELLKVTTEDIKNFIDSEFSSSLRNFLYYECLVDERYLTKYIFIERKLPNLKQFLLNFYAKEDAYIFECDKLQNIDFLKIIIKQSEEKKSDLIKYLDEALTTTKNLDKLKSLSIPESYNNYNKFFKSDLVKKIPIITYRGEDNDYTKKQTKPTCMNLANESFNITNPAYRDDPLYKRMRIRSYVNEFENFIRSNFETVEYLCLQSTISRNSKNLLIKCNFINLKEFRAREPSSGMLESMSLIKLPLLEILHLHEKTIYLNSSPDAVIIKKFFKAAFFKNIKVLKFNIMLIENSFEEIEFNNLQKCEKISLSGSLTKPKIFSNLIKKIITLKEVSIKKMHMNFRESEEEEEFLSSLKDYPGVLKMSLEQYERIFKKELSIKLKCKIIKSITKIEPCIYSMLENNSASQTKAFFYSYFSRYNKLTYSITTSIRMIRELSKDAQKAYDMVKDMTIINAKLENFFVITSPFLDLILNDTYFNAYFPLIFRVQIEILENSEKDEIDKVLLSLMKLVPLLENVTQIKIVVNSKQDCFTYNLTSLEQFFQATKEKLMHLKEFCISFVNESNEKKNNISIVQIINMVSTYFTGNLLIKFELGDIDFDFSNQKAVLIFRRILEVLSDHFQYKQLYLKKAYENFKLTHIKEDLSEIHDKILNCECLCDLFWKDRSVMINMQPILISDIVKGKKYPESDFNEEFINEIFLPHLIGKNLREINQWEGENNDAIIDAFLSVRWFNAKDNESKAIHQVIPFINPKQLGIIWTKYGSHGKQLDFFDKLLKLPFFSDSKKSWSFKDFESDDARIFDSHGMNSLNIWNFQRALKSLDAQLVKDNGSEINIVMWEQIDNINDWIFGKIKIDFKSEGKITELRFSPENNKKDETDAITQAEKLTTDYNKMCLLYPLENFNLNINESFLCKDVFFLKTEHIFLNSKSFSMDCYAELPFILYEIIQKANKEGSLKIVQIRGLFEAKDMKKEIKFVSGERKLTLKLDKMSISLYSLFELICLIDLANCDLTITHFTIELIRNPTHDEEVQKALIKFLKFIKGLKILQIPIANLSEFIKVLECDSLKDLEELTIGINELINEELELIAHCKNLKNLKKLHFSLESPFSQQVNRDPLYNNVVLGIKELFHSEYVTSIDWVDFFDKNYQLVNDEIINMLCDSPWIKKIENFFMRMGNYEQSTYLKVLDSIDLKLFNMKSFIFNGIVNEKFEPLVFIKLLTDARLKEFMTKNDKNEINLVQKSPIFDLLEEIRKNTISQIKIETLIRNETYMPQINDMFLEVFCAFKEEFTASSFTIAGLPPGLFPSISPKAINLLIKTYPYPNMPNLYNWILENPYWSKMLDDSLLIILKNTTEVWLTNLDLNHHPWLSSQFLKLHKGKNKKKNLELFNKCENCIFELLSKCPLVESINLQGLNLDDVFCEKLSLFFSANQHLNSLKSINLSKNPNISFIGNKYLYTIVVDKSNTISAIKADCDIKLYSSSNLLVNQGLDAAIKFKFNDYKQKYKEKGCGIYDIGCLPLLFYSFFCFFLAITQYSKQCIKINEKLDRLYQKIMKILTFKQKNVKYTAFIFKEADEDSNEFIFNENGFELNNFLKRRTILLAFIIHIILYLFFSIFPPFYFFSFKCGDSIHYNSHILYGSFACLSCCYEGIFLYYIISILQGKMSKSSFLIDSLVALVMSQIAKLNLYSDIMFLAINFSCNLTTNIIISLISLGCYYSFCLIHIVSNIFEMFQLKHQHNTTFINLYGEMTYDHDLNTISSYLEKYTTCSAIQFGRNFFPYIIIINTYKFCVIDLPHAIIQFLHFYLNNEYNSAISIFSFCVSTFSMIMAFFTALKTKPSTCSQDTLDRVSYKPYRSMLETIKSNKKINKNKVYFSGDESPMIDCETAK